MDTEEILKFIDENQGEKLADFYDKSYDKLKDLNRRIDKISLYLIIIIFLYFITSKAAIASFQIGPISISDISLLTIIIPVLFAYVLLDLAITSGHKAEVFATVKLIFFAMYKQKVSSKDLEEGRNNLFSRLILPFSYSSEYGKFFASKKMSFIGCLGALLIFPLIIFIFLPFYFEYYMLKEIYLHYYSTSLGKICFWLSIWIMLLVVFYYINTTNSAMKNPK